MDSEAPGNDGGGGDRMTIAVSGMSMSNTLAPGLPVLRTLRTEPAFVAMNPRIVAISYDPMAPVGYDPELCDDCYLFPYPMFGPERLLTRLREVHQRTPLTAIIPTLDSELSNYIQILPQLREMGIGVVLPSQEALDLRSKARLPELSTLTGVRVPWSRTANSVAEALQVSKEFPWPMVVKGRLYSATIVYDTTRLTACVERFASKWGYPVIVQEFVSGVEYDVAALGGPKGELLGVIPMKKLQLDDLGKAWGAITIDDPGLINVARKVVHKLKWHGPLEVEIIRQAVTGQPFLIEVNPRFPAWINLSAAAGQNLPWGLLQMALGKEPQPFPGYRTNVMQLRRSYDVTCELGVYEALVTHGEIHHPLQDPALIQPEFVAVDPAPPQDEDHDHDHAEPSGTVGASPSGSSSLQTETSLAVEHEQATSSSTEQER